MQELLQEIVREDVIVQMVKCGAGLWRNVCQRSLLTIMTMKMTIYLNYEHQNLPQQYNHQKSLSLYWKKDGANGAHSQNVNLMEGRREQEDCLTLMGMEDGLRKSKLNLAL